MWGLIYPQPKLATTASLAGARGAILPKFASEHVHYTKSSSQRVCNAVNWALILGWVGFKSHQPPLASLPPPSLRGSHTPAHRGRSALSGPHILRFTRLPPGLFMHMHIPNCGTGGKGGAAPGCAQSMEEGPLSPSRLPLKTTPRARLPKAHPLLRQLLLLMEWDLMNTSTSRFSDQSVELGGAYNCSHAAPGTGYQVVTAPR